MAALIGFIYRFLLRPILFRKDPEKAHDAVLAFGEKLGGRPVLRVIISSAFRYENKILRRRLLGIDFANPVGLAAGFDKNGRLTEILPSFGFGFEEVGSVTNEPSEGNPKPRLQRLIKSRGIVVNYGLPNIGVDAVLSGLKEKTFSFPIGISIARTNSPKTATKEAGIADYANGFLKAAESKVGEYITLNISCPNAFGGEPFTDATYLEDLLSALDPVPNTKPVLVKMPADLDKVAFDALLRACRNHHIQGVIISNLTKDRSSSAIDQDEIKKAMPKGGISGRPAFEKSNELIRFTYQNYKNDFVIIGCGGIFSAEDAYTKIRNGASLVQLITGMIFEGPQLICEINRGLAHLLERDGYANIQEAVGVGA